MDEHRIVTSDGEQRVISGAVIDRFASDLRGELLFPEDERYDAGVERHDRQAPGINRALCRHSRRHHLRALCPGT